MSTDSTLRFPGRYVAHAGDRPAVIMAETGKTLTYSELHAYASRLSRLFDALGLKPGDHVAYCVENRVECAALQWGAHYAGLYYTFISTRLKQQEVAYIIEDCGAKAVVLDEKTAEVIRAAVGSLSSPPKLYSLDASVKGLPLLAEAIAEYAPTPMEGALEGCEMLYSSGTTGRPKGVKPQATGLPLGTSAVVADLMARAFGVNESSVYLSPAPYYHAAPLKWVQGTTALGGTTVLMAKFDAEGLLSTIERYKATHTQLVPTMFHRLLQLPDDVRSKYDLSSQKIAVHAAAPCPVPTKLAMIQWWGPIIFEYYSCTEGIGMTFSDSDGWLKHQGTVGRPLYGEIHIVGEDGENLPTGQEGLVYFSGGRPFSYHNDPKQTAEAHNAQAWATVGDIGRIDEDGYLYLTDRKSNMIISGGVNVYPQETENHLLTHPKVFDVAVIGTPHADLGEEVRAVVQLMPGVEPSQAVVDELIAHCRAELSSIKSPRVIDFRDALPREPNGKLLKRLLVAEYRAKA